MDQPTNEAPEQRITIALKMPGPLQERILSFPMIHLLREAYPNADLHFICPEHKIEVLYALPFDGYWHPWKEDEIKTPLDVHRMATDLKIPPVDIYFSLGDSLNELSLGMFLRAKKKVGFAEGWKGWFTTFPVKRPVGHHITEDFYFLFKEFTNRRIPEKMQVKSREFTPFYKEEEPPYLAVDLWPFVPGKLDEFWFDFFEMHEEKSFKLFFSQDEAKGALLAEKFVQRLSPKNKYELFLSSNWIELGKVLSQSRGLVTRAGASASLAAYIGTSTLIIYETGEPRRDAPIPFYADWQLLDLRDPTLGLAQPATGVVKPKIFVDAAVLFETASNMFHY